MSLPPPGVLPDPGIEPASLAPPALQADSLPLAPPGKLLVLPNRAVYGPGTNPAPTLGPWGSRWVPSPVALSFILVAGVHEFELRSRPLITAVYSLLLALSSGSGGLSKLQALP